MSCRAGTVRLWAAEIKWRSNCQRKKEKNERDIASVMEDGQEDTLGQEKEVDEGSMML